MTFIVCWGPENAWRTAYGSQEEAQRHADEIRDQWPDVAVEPGP